MTSNPTAIYPKKFLLALGLALSLTGAACGASQPTKYGRAATGVKIKKAPRNFNPIKVALVQFKNETGKNYLLKPAVSQLTSLMTRSGYYEVTEPTFTARYINKQNEITPEALELLKKEYGVDYLVTGTLTNFEIRKDKSGLGFFFGLFASKTSEKYSVEVGIDYRVLSVPQARIVTADVVENVRSDTSKAAHILFTGGGNTVEIKQNSGGKLLRYAMADMVNKLSRTLPKRAKNKGGR